MGFYWSCTHRPSLLSNALKQHVIFNATDADVIKPMLSLDLGSGIIAHNGFRDSSQDAPLQAMMPVV